MKPGSGKSKGSAFERSVSKRLSFWVTGVEDGDPIFWRSINSGAMRTNARKKSKDHFASQQGDITAVLPEARRFITHFGVECKHYADLQVDQLIYRTSLKGEHLLPFWHKHQEDCNQAGKAPLLVARQNRKFDLLLMSHESHQELELFSSKTGMPRLQKMPCFLASTIDCLVLDFDTFLATYSYEHFETALMHKGEYL